MLLYLINSIKKTRDKCWKLFFLTLFIALCSGIKIYGQDIHFSQFYTTPIFTNPANTGMSDDDLRIANNYRNQWAKIGTNYNTLYVSLDKKLSILNQSFGIGGFIVHDQSSAFNLTADEFLFSLSYSKIINNQQFVIGIQPGFIYKHYNASSLTYSSQFDQANQVFNSNFPSLEEGLSGSTQHFDMNVGVSWRTHIRNIVPSAGFAVNHVIRPVETFSSSSSGTRLPMKLTFNSQVCIPINSKFDITPSVLYGYTSGVNELLVGNIGGYAIANSALSVKRIYAINIFRLNPSSNIDAIILGGGIKFKKLDWGFTYDINVSPLSKATNFNGAFEISLIYTGGSIRKRVNEPCYIY
jgi:type IX secretion system PorP/SprF family membrane protein